MALFRDFLDYWLPPIETVSTERPEDNVVTIHEIEGNLRQEQAKYDASHRLVIRKAEAHIDTLKDVMARLRGMQDAQQAIASAESAMQALDDAREGRSSDRESDSE